MITCTRILCAVIFLGGGCSKVASLQDPGAVNRDAVDAAAAAPDAALQPISMCPPSGCDCKDGDTLACGETVGACEPGVQRCQDGEWGPCEDVSPQKKRVMPTVEVCDGQDNDCDGDVDEGCDCRAGAMRWCNGGQGVCQSGQQTCVTGSWGPCMPVQAAKPETCDGLDNNCDGTVDEGFNLGVPCDSTGRCPQTRRCTADGAASVCADDKRLFSDERCDGVDNDCDGLVDLVSKDGSLQSVCGCLGRTLAIGAATDESIKGNTNLCGSVCGGDKPRGLLVDARCYPACQAANSDPDGDGWGYENGASCLVAMSARGSAAPPCDDIPLGLALTYCLDCTGTDRLPYAMCQSVPKFDLRSFGQGKLWLKVDFTFVASAPAGTQINLWFEGDAHRKHLPLVRIGDLPGRYQKLLRVEDACFTASAFGDACTGAAKHCAHCESDEVCGAITSCGGYDLGQAWLQVAAEFCGPGSGQHRGTVTVHHVELVEPNCAP